MTGLIYVGIIAVWAIILVPAWLRRHDHRDPQRSVNRFTRSLEELSRRDSLLGIRMSPAEQRTPDQSAGADHVGAGAQATQVRRVQRPSGQAAVRSGRPTVARRAQADSTVGFRPAPVRAAAARRAAVRRRIVLGVLSAALAVVAGLVVGGVLLPIALAVPGALLIGFTVVARHQVRQAQRRRASVGRDRSVPQPAAWSPGHPASVATGSTWEARPTTLPTYVTAPPAAEFPRVIDTQTPGAWTAAAMLERAQQQKDRSERMAAARAQAIARAQAEQEAAEARTRDEEYLDQQAAAWEAQNTTAPLYHRRVVNE